MFSPSHSCCSADSKKSSVPCPGLLKGPAKGTKLIKFTAPRYHPVSARLFRKPCGAQNAVTGRTVRPYCRSGRPLGSELQPAPARKPSQPVKLLSLLRCACLLSPSLRLEYSGRGHFDNRESSYHILGRFASGAGRFRGISAFFLLFRLEVYPFIAFIRAWSMIYASRSFAMGRFCFALIKPLRHGFAVPPPLARGG